MSWRKNSTASVETSGGSNGSRSGGVTSKGEYPFALTLRIRVVQIVCGIAAVVMGSVAAIEERHNFNLSLGVPAGSVTVLAAAWSVHRSIHRNAGGRRIGGWIAKFFWAAAYTLQVALLATAMKTIVKRHEFGEDYTSNTSLSLAVVHGLLAATTLAAALVAARLRWIYGPPPLGPISRSDLCPRSTSHTGVSMVPLTSVYGCQTIMIDNISKSGDNLSSDNETMEINITDNKASFKDSKSPVKNKNVVLDTGKNDFQSQSPQAVNVDPEKLSRKDKIECTENVKNDVNKDENKGRIEDELNHQQNNANSFHYDLSKNLVV